MVTDKFICSAGSFYIHDTYQIVLKWTDNGQDVMFML